MTTSPAGQYWIHFGDTSQADRIYYFGPEGAQYCDLATNAWFDLPDFITADDVPDLTSPSPTPHGRRPRAPIALLRPMVHRVKVEGVTYEWEGAFTMETAVDIDGKLTTVDKIVAPGGISRDWLLYEGVYVLRAPVDGSESEPVWRLDPPQRSIAPAPPALWDQAIAALEEAHAYPILTPEYRAGVQRAYQLFEQVTVLEGREAQSWRDEAAEIGRKLAVYLSIDWTDVDLVEVRYADGATEMLHLVTEPESRERLRDAVAVRFPEYPE